jgi:hypothetical protein
MEDLEARFERLRITVLQMQAQLAAVAQGVQQLPGGGTPTASAAAIYSIAPVVIAAGGNETGLTVYALQGGSSVALPGTYTVYNQMAVATVATADKTILVAPNGDGTFMAVTQSC